jgi:ribonuclease HI
MYIN